MVQRTWTGRVILKGEKRGVNKAFASAENSIGNVAKRLKGLAGFAAFAAVGAAVAGAGKKIAEFEKSISALSAITGATGKDLDRLTEASKRIGATTTLSASQAAEAFKLMASAKPDLLDNLDALERTTEASVTLAEAAGLELPQATAALGEALNQFGKGADDATRFIDVLAQGARLGSSEIGETSEALKNAGVVARLAGLSFEETNAAIQGMASAGVKGSDAGTKLRSVLVKLQTQANDEFNPAVVGINTALENLAEANLTATEKVELFGEKQVVSAEILIDQRRNIKNLSVELEDSMGAALDQANTRTDNLAGDMKRLGSVFEAVQLNLANNSLPVFRGVAQAFTRIMGIIDKLTASEGINKADEDFSALNATLDALFVTGVFIKNIFDIIVGVFADVGRIIGAVMTGSLDNVMDAIDVMNTNATKQVDDMARAVFETYNATAAQAIRDGEASLVQASDEVLTEIIVNAKRRTVTAGEEAATAALAVAAAEAEKLRLKEAARIEGIREGFRTERQVVAEEWILKLEQLNELELAGAEIGQTFSEARVALALETAKKIAAIETKGLTTRQKFEQKTTVDKGKFLLGEGMKLTQGVSQQSKTMFKINKTLALANAAATLPSAVIKAIDNGGGLPWGAIPGAITLAAGLAQIQAIKSTTFSGGGGGTSPSLAGSSGTVNSVPVGGAGGLGAGPLDLPADAGALSPGRNVSIQIDGLPSAGPVPAEMVRELIDGINEQLGDGANLDTSAGSGT